MGFPSKPCPPHRPRGLGLVHSTSRATPCGRGVTRRTGTSWGPARTALVLISVLNSPDILFFDFVRCSDPYTEDGYSLLTVFPAPLGPTKIVRGLKKVIICLSLSSIPKLRTPIMLIFSILDMFVNVSYLNTRGLEPSKALRQGRSTAGAGREAAGASEGSGWNPSSHSGFLPGRRARVGEGRPGDACGSPKTLAERPHHRAHSQIPASAAARVT